MRRAERILSLVATVGALSTATHSARAGFTKAECLAANTSAQDLRRDGKLAAARAQLKICIDASCPAVVRDDCTKRLDDADKAQPTMIFEVKDASSSDVTAVKIADDGTVIADKLTGTALPVDPGSHEFTFTVDGYDPIKKTFLVVEGEKGRRERITLPAKAAPPLVAAAPLPVTIIVPPPPPNPLPPVAPAQPRPNEGMGSQKVAGLVGIGLGAAGLVAGGVFGGLAVSKKSSEESDISNLDLAAAASDRSTGETDALISTIAFVAGGVLAAGGLVLLLTARSSSEKTAMVVPSAAPGGGSLTVVGSF